MLCMDWQCPSYPSAHEHSASDYPLTVPVAAAAASDWLNLSKIDVAIVTDDSITCDVAVVVLGPRGPEL